ncbi:hypothetical protein ACSHT0_00030 [Tepidicaulis sp. LMO-SS28]|uniref:hypothetical protein n=1 Tax=Tepidicaulis sp. LMO-SS28 TaxID=3447455 RepID=UPI003EDF67A3
MNRDALLALLESAIAQVNAGLPPEKKIPPGPGTALTGAESELDSLTLTTLFFEVEARVNAESDRTVDLFSAPFLLEPDTSMTIRGLADWLSAEVNA